MNKLLLAALVCSALNTSAQNLIVNPGAESAVVSPWSVFAAPGDPTCNSTVNWRANLSSLNINARTGSSNFFPGCNSGVGGVYELRQTVSVSGSATVIDLGNAQYTFAGWYSNWNQAAPDQCAYQLDFLNGSSTVLSSSSSGWLTSATNTTGTQGPWLRSVLTAAAPVGTRSIMVRVLARHNSGSAIDSYFDDLSLTTGPSPLPLTMSPLEATALSTGVRLRWEDFQTQIQEHYTVQWSRDAQDWTAVGQLAPKAPGRFEFFHAPASGANYYRIAVRSKDNTVSFSNTVSVDHAAATSRFTVSPNPANGIVYINGIQHAAECSIINIQGQAVRRLSVMPGQTSLDISNLNPGLYVVRIASEHSIQTERLIVR